jgi:hypothetical protein
VDLVSAFAIVVFAAGWYFWSNSAADEPITRLFFATIMFLGAGIGLLGWLLRLMVG